jgi:hypothetical protein
MMRLKAELRVPHGFRTAGKMAGHPGRTGVGYDKDGV